MTVSLALREHPSISAATKARVQELAREAGYRPDPEVAKLMHHLRTRRSTAYQATLCGLRSRPGTVERDYGDQIAEGARERAEALGFGFQNMWLDDPALRGRSLHRTLRSRGIEGLLLLPLATPADLAEILRWEEFSVVTTTFSVLAPDFNGVIPDQFGNMMKLCDHFVRQGIRRPGLVTQANHDLRVDHRFTAALAWHTVYKTLTPPAPFFPETWPPPREALLHWFQEARPDALIADSASRAKTLRQLLAPLEVDIYCTGLLAANTGHRGINEHPREIGAVAVEMLSGLLQRGIKGIPAVPHLTLIEGALVK
jgi:DNA-binding LacI/PurR family transcriptional regulator